MNEFIKPIVNDKIIRWTVIISGIFLILSIALIIIFFSTLPPLMPLFNQLPWGERRLAPTWMFFLPVLTSLFIIFMNIIMTRYIYEKMPLIARMLHTTGFLVSLFTIIFVFRTIRLII